MLFRASFRASDHSGTDRTAEPCGRATCEASVTSKPATSMVVRGAFSKSHGYRPDRPDDGFMSGRLRRGGNRVALERSNGSHRPIPGERGRDSRYGCYSPQPPPKWDCSKRKRSGAIFLVSSCLEARQLVHTGSVRQIPSKVLCRMVFTFRRISQWS